MTISFAIIFCAIIYGSYRLAFDYVTKSKGSFSHAEVIWNEITRISRDIIDSDIPPSVARAVVGLVSTAGCGCFVRGMLLSYYLPTPSGVDKNPGKEWERSFDDLRHLSDVQRDLFNQLMARVIVYDSFRNPLQGLLFRRALKSFMKNEQTFVQRMRTELTVLKILSGNASRMPLASERSHA
jgi:hypothetical protein